MANSIRCTETPVVFVVDGDALVRQQLDRLIRSAGYRPRAVGSAEEFLACPRSTHPSCLLTESRLPGVSGLDLQELMRERQEMPVIFMCEHTDVQAAIRAMKAGALEVLAKPLSAAELLAAVHCGIEHSRARLHRSAQIQRLQGRYASLTDREKEVMSLVVAGRTNHQVGDDLGISEDTVKAHRGRVMRKMHAASLAELVTMVALAV